MGERADAAVAAVRTAVNDVVAALAPKLQELDAAVQVAIDNLQAKVEELSAAIDEAQAGGQDTPEPTAE